MNFKKRFINQVSNIGQAYTRYPITMLLFVVLSIVNAIQIVDEFSGYERLVHGLLVGVLLTMVATHVNERFIAERVKQWGILIGSVVLSILYYFILPQSDTSYLIYEVRTAVLVFALFIAFIWIPSIKNTQTYFYQYFLAAFKYGFTTLLYGVILSLGFQAILSSIDYLLFNVDYDYFIHVANVIWFLFVPSYFLSLVPPTNIYILENEPHVEEATGLISEKREAFEVTKFFKILLNYIVIPLIGAYTLILVAYILLNIGGEFWTDNLLEPMLISYTIIVILVYLLACNLAEPIPIYFRKIFPKILIPIVLFQSIASVLKIREMSITHGRYYVILFGIFALIAGIIFSFLGKEKTGWIVPFLVGLSVLSVLPPIDAFTVGRNSQTTLLTETLENNNMLSNNQVQADGSISQEDKEKITASLDYLYYLDYDLTLDYLPKDFEYYDDFEKVFGFPMTYEDSGVEDELNQYAYLEWPGNETVLISDEDYFIQLYLSNYDEEPTETIVEMNESYTLKAKNELPYFEIRIDNEIGEEVMVIDLEPLFIGGLAASSGGQQQANEQDMTIISENDELRVRMIATELMKNSSNSVDSISAQLFIFIDVKNK